MTFIVSEMEYDHLNYTPPANTWKPHYVRMNGSIGGGQASTPPIPPLPKLHTAVPIVPGPQVQGPLEPGEPSVLSDNEAPPPPPTREEPHEQPL